MNDKTVINIWKGSAYLHQEFQICGLTHVKDTPLGNDTRLIKRIRDAFDCQVIFLNDDFTVDEAATEEVKH